MGLWAACVFVSAAMANDRVHVFAAASLRGGLEAALQGWSEPHRISYGGSGAIARQVSLGAPADLVILASPIWDAWLAKELPDHGSSAPFLGNRLVLIGAPKAQPFKARPDTAALKAVLAGARLAMGQRDAVPAGQYGRAWLEHIGAWTALSPHLAEAENVRVALTYVARGEAPLGLVYATDARADPRVRVLWQIDPETHPDIIYPARAITPKGARLLAFLQSPKAQASFAALGYRPAKAPAP